MSSLTIHELSRLHWVDIQSHYGMTVSCDTKEVTLPPGWSLNDDNLNVLDHEDQIVGSIVDNVVTFDDDRLWELGIIDAGLTSD